MPKKQQINENLFLFKTNYSQNEDYINIMGSKDTLTESLKSFEDSLS
jgi:hypothetical protein